MGDSSTVLVQDAVAQLDERGYAIVERRADPAIMDRLLQEVQPYADKAERLTLKFFGGGLRKVESVVTKSPAFVTLMSDPLLHQLSEAILGPEPLLNGSSVFILEKGGRDQTLHNDGTIYEPMLARARVGRTTCSCSCGPSPTSRRRTARHARSRGVTCGPPVASRPPTTRSTTSRCRAARSPSGSARRSTPRAPTTPTPRASARRWGSTVAGCARTRRTCCSSPRSSRATSR